MEAGATVVCGVQPYPGAPPGGAVCADPVGDRAAFVAPLKSAQPRQLVGNDGAFEPAGGIRLGEGKIATARTIDTGNRAQRVDPVVGWFDHLDNVGVPI